ncbi:DEAD/DEAH box helicase [Candidatus Nanohalovita haloferacivicina]|uniref:DEAD/DEAH box helicase n=1 Tax=Candidatus Nanohalovita haloferacivicina TaxID=2978046 RepID=UPI00325FB608|nr:ATP-dependent RNA helicase DeaD [Candidatus Nanohalobia archaeon BNXNv]
MNFSELDISDRTVDRLAKHGITEPTEVQQKAIPKVFEGKDMLVESETGSGKTLAFSLPIMEQVHGSESQALVLSPTRELAKQITQEIDSAAGKPVETVTIYGGVSYDPQVEGAKTANIIVGTPGRVLDLLSSGQLKVDNLDFFVLDEADRMLDMGFQDELEDIISYLPDERQNLLFGATIPRSLKKMCDRYDIDPETIRIKKSQHTRNLDEKYVNAKSNNKLSMLYTFLEDRDRDLSVVFCKTKATTRWLADKLRKNGIDAQELNGDMSQKQREKTLEEFANAEIRVIVATDVAARGIDVDRVTHVFNYDVPDTADTYTHRIGRAGRQGREGEAITLLEPKDHDKFRRIKKRKSIPRIEEKPNLKDANV